MIAIVLSIAIVAIAQIVKGITGFGSALVSVPVLTLLWGPVEGIFLAGFCDVVGGAVLLPGAWKQLDFRLIAAMYLPLVVVQNFATDLLTTIPAESFHIAMGVVVLVMGLDMALRPEVGCGDLTALPEPPYKFLGIAAVAGAAAGGFSGLFGTPGPPSALFFRRFFEKTFMRAHILALFWPAALGLMLMLTFKGGITDLGHAYTNGAMLVPSIFVGAVFGARLARKLSRAAFSRMVGLVLTGAGLALLLS